jgi:hypothetical protein
MRGLAAILGLTMTLGIGYLLYERSTVSEGLTQSPPQQQIDLIAIKSELQTIGQAERQYILTNPGFGTIDELRAGQLLVGEVDRRGYTFVVEVNGAQGFTCTASPTDPSKTGWPTLAIDETMQVVER